MDGREEEVRRKKDPALKATIKKKRKRRARQREEDSGQDTMLPGREMRKDIQLSLKDVPWVERALHCQRMISIAMYKSGQDYLNQTYMFKSKRITDAVWGGRWR